MDRITEPYRCKILDFNKEKFLTSVQSANSNVKVKEVAQKHINGDVLKCSDASLETLLSAALKQKIAERSIKESESSEDSAETSDSQMEHDPLNEASEILENCSVTSDSQMELESLKVLPMIERDEVKSTSDLEKMPLVCMKVCGKKPPSLPPLNKKVSEKVFEALVKELRGNFKQICEEESKDIKDHDIGEYEIARKADIDQYYLDLVSSMGINRTKQKYKVLSQEIESLRTWFMKFIDQKIITYLDRVIIAEKLRVCDDIKGVSNLLNFKRSAKDKTEVLFARLGADTNSDKILSLKKRDFIAWFDNKISSLQLNKKPTVKRSWKKVISDSPENTEKLYKPRDTHGLNRDFEDELTTTINLSELKQKWLQRLSVLCFRKTGSFVLGGVYLKSKEFMEKKLKALSKIEEFLAMNPEVMGLQIACKGKMSFSKRIENLVFYISQEVESGFKISDSLYRDMFVFIDNVALRGDWTLAYFAQKAYKFSTIDWMERYSAEDKFDEAVIQMRDLMLSDHPFPKSHKRATLDKASALLLASYSLAYNIEVVYPKLSHKDIVTKVVEQTPISYFFQLDPIVFNPTDFAKNLLERLQDESKR